MPIVEFLVSEHIITFMYYVSKITPFFLFKALIFLGLSLALRHTDWLLSIVFLLYGFIASTLIGAMYQIVPNSQSRKLYFPKLPYLVFVLNIISLVLFSLNKGALASGVLLLSYILFSASIFLTIKNWKPITVRFLSASVVFLNLSTIFLLLSQLNLVPFRLAVHTLTLGAMLNAVYGVELAWIPMLTMTTLNFKKALNLFYAKQFSTLFILVSFYITTHNLLIFASIVEFAVALFYLSQIYSILKQRRIKTTFPIPVRFFIFALLLLPFGLFVGFLMSIFPEWTPTLLELHYNLLIYGFTAFTIFGGIAHLLPRIIYNWKFSERQGVSIGDFIDEPSLPTFFKLSVSLYLTYLVLDLLPDPASLISSFIYIVLLLYFFKLTFFKALSAFLYLRR